MEGLAVLVVLLLLSVVIGSFLGFLAFLKIGELKQRIASLERLWDQARSNREKAVALNQKSPEFVTPSATTIKPSAQVTALTKQFESAPSETIIKADAQELSSPLNKPTDVDAALSTASELPVPTSSVSSAQPSKIDDVTAPPVSPIASAIAPDRPAAKVEAAVQPLISTSQQSDTISPSVAVPHTNSATTTDQIEQIKEKTAPSLAAAASSVATTSTATPSSTTSSFAKLNKPAENNKATDEQISFESMVGKRWLTWAGIAMVFLGSVFFLKYAYDQEWLGKVITPPVRIGLLMCGAIAMMVIGLRLLRQGMTAIGHGLAGGAIAVSYLTIYGAFSPALMLVPEPLLPAGLAFVLMAVVTVAGMTLAVRFNAMAMAICAVVGGFATPLLIDTGGGSRDGLFTYILLLNLGVLGAAWFRRWQVLDLLTFIGTLGMYAGWLYTREPVPIDAWGMTAWLLVFHILFIVLPFAHHWHTRSAISVRRFVMVIGNVAFTLAHATILLSDEHKLGLAGVCMALALLYAAAGIITRRVIDDDDKVVNSFLTMGAMLMVLSFFYMLPVEAVATAWFAEAVVLLVLGYRYVHVMTRHIAVVVFVLGILRLLAVQVDAAPVDAVFIFNGWMNALLMAPLGMIGMALTHRYFNPTSLWHRGSWWLSLGLFLAVGSAELMRSYFNSNGGWPVLPLPSALSAWWLIGAGFLLYAARRWQSSESARLVSIPMCFAMIGAVLAYQTTTISGWPVLNMRCLIAVSVLISLYGIVRCFSTARTWTGSVLTLGPWQVALPLGIVFVATLETITWTYVHDESSRFSTHHVLVAVWSCAAIVAAFLSHQWRNRYVGCAGVVPLVLALGSAFLLYSRSDLALPPLANARFLLLTLAIGAFALQGLVFPAVAWIPTVLQLTATAGLICEGLAWSDAAFSGNVQTAWGFWTLTFICAVSAGIGFYRWQRGAFPGAAWTGIAIGFFAGMCSVIAYMAEWHASLPFLNGRFFTTTLAIAALMYGRHVLTKRQLGDDASLTSFVSYSACGLLFIAASSEPVAYFHELYPDEAVASRLSTFAVTVVWVILAMSALMLGFRYRQRTVRLLALSLFALTAAKVLLFDMSGVQQIYRILAFMLVGVVFIVASYIYHRLEKRLLGNESPAAEPSMPSAATLNQKE